MADLWDPVERAYAICAFAAGAFVGPVAGPIVGGFVTESYLGWRWTAWITLIMASLFGIIGLIIISETSAARILQIRAKELRYSTKNWALHSKADENRITAGTIVTVYLARPFVMIVKEPILALITAYMSYLYGVVYLLFEAVSTNPIPTPQNSQPQTQTYAKLTVPHHSSPSPSTTNAAGPSASPPCPSAPSSSASSWAPA